MIAVLLRHAPVRRSPPFDKLSPQGESMARALPAVVATWELKPAMCFFDSSVQRCHDTVSQLPMSLVPYGPGQELRTLNSALRAVDSVALICYRFASIESGDLYHVDDFELHTDFHATNYDERVEIARRRSSNEAVVIKATTSSWRQIGTLQLARPRS